MKSKHLRATAVSLLAGGGLLGLGVPAATAATAATTHAEHSAVTTAKKVTPTLTAAGREKAAAARTAAAGTSGAISLINNDFTGPDTATFTITQGTSTLATSSLEQGDVTYSLLFPAGQYTLTVTGGSGTSAITAAKVFTVTGGQDRTESLYAGSVAATIDDTVDNVTGVTTGAATVSVRNESPSAGAVDAYINGKKVLSNIAVGASADVGVSSGAATLSIDKAGTTTVVIPASEDSDATVAPSSYDVAYLASGPSATPYVLNGNTFLQGYAFTASDGGTFNYGSYPFEGSLANIRLNKPVVGGALSSVTGGDYLVASDGGVFAFNAPYLGSTGNIKLDKPIVAMVATNGNDGNGGYLLVASDGGVFAYNTPFYGSLGGKTLPAPVVSASADPTTGEYFMALADGTVVDFNSSGTSAIKPPATNLAAPVVGIALTPDTAGYWLVAADGGVFAEGDAGFYGSTGNIKLNQPITGIQPAYDGLGYSLIARDGGIFSYGNSRFFGSTGAIKLAQPVVGPIAIP